MKKPNRDRNRETRERLTLTQHRARARSAVQALPPLPFHLTAFAVERHFCSDPSCTTLVLLIRDEHGLTLAVHLAPFAARAIEDALKTAADNLKLPSLADMTADLETAKETK